MRIIQRMEPFILMDLLINFILIFVFVMRFAVVIDGKEKDKIGRSYDSKKKIVTAVELTDNEKVKRMHALKIHNYSAQELATIFNKHINKYAKITTDKWKGYRPLFELYNITQIESNNRMNFIALRTMIASPIRA